MNAFAKTMKHHLTKYKYFDGTVTAHQFLALFGFWTCMADLLRASCKSEFQMQVWHCYGNRVKKCGLSKAKAPVFSGLWMNFMVRLAPLEPWKPPGSATARFPRMPRKAIRDLAAGLELLEQRCRFYTGRPGDWHITVFCHRRSVDERLAEIPTTEVDWRPTESIPEDYYAM
jgi:hypothetical protein